MSNIVPNPSGDHDDIDFSWDPDVYKPSWNNDAPQVVPTYVMHPDGRVFHTMTGVELHIDRYDEEPVSRPVVRGAALLVFLSLVLFIVSVAAGVSGLVLRAAF